MIYCSILNKVGVYKILKSLNPVFSYILNNVPTFLEL